MGLLALSTFLDYVYGFSVASPNRRKAKLFLWLSVANNLGLLAVFKYYNFFAIELTTLFESIGWHVSPVLLQVALPVGISFYTFHGMSYVFDIYKKRQKPVSNFIDYAVFVAFFPLLVAGPIERANHLLPQVQRPRTFRYVQAVQGCRLILWGLFKKVCIADTLAVSVDNAFENYGSYNGITLVAAMACFAFQIYCDFGGYSDIALGTAKLFGFELLSNFRFPYFSRDIAEFWRRWHMSLSSWFRDYLYFPMGGSREGKVKAVFNTFVIFIVSGFWHGASWNFIVWGLLHALGFIPLLLANRNRTHTGEVVAGNAKVPSLKELIQMSSTFAFVTFAWIFFRAKSLEGAGDYIYRTASTILDPMPSGSFIDGRFAKAFIFIIPLLVLDWYLRRDERRLRMPSNRAVRYMIYWTLMILIFLRMNASQSDSFIYFQF